MIVEGAADPRADGVLAAGVDAAVAAGRAAAPIARWLTIVAVLAGTLVSAMLLQSGAPPLVDAAAIATAWLPSVAGLALWRWAARLAGSRADLLAAANNVRRELEALGAPRGGVVGPIRWLWRLARHVHPRLDPSVAVLERVRPSPAVVIAAVAGPPVLVAAIPVLLVRNLLA